MKKTIVTKDKHLHVRIDGTDKKTVRRAAERAGKRLSDYVRESATMRAMGLLVEVHTSIEK